MAALAPGTLLLLASLFLLVGVIFLVRDMSKRTSRMRYNAMSQAAQRRNTADD